MEILRMSTKGKPLTCCHLLLGLLLLLLLLYTSHRYRLLLH
jgi:hypothetical protein